MRESRPAAVVAWKTTVSWLLHRNETPNIYVGLDVG